MGTLKQKVDRFGRFSPRRQALCYAASWFKSCLLLPYVALRQKLGWSSVIDAADFGASRIFSHLFAVSVYASALPLVRGACLQRCAVVQAVSFDECVRFHIVRLASWPGRPSL